MSASCSAPIMPVVSGVFGMCTVTKSLWRSTSSNDRSSTCSCCARVGRDVRVVADDAHAERAQPLGDQRADASEADDADGLLEQLGAGVGTALPLPGGQRRVGVRDVPGKAEDVADRELGGRDDVRRRGVHDHDAGRRRGLDVDVVEADTGARDDLQLRSGRDRLGVDLRGRAHQDGIRLGECREQRGPIGAVDLADVEVRTQCVDRGGREFFGDEHDGLRHDSGSFGAWARGLRPERRVDAAPHAIGAHSGDTLSARPAMVRPV